MEQTEDNILDFDLTVALRSLYLPYKQTLQECFDYRYSMIDWNKGTSYKDDCLKQLPHTECRNGANTFYNILDTAIPDLLLVSENLEQKSRGVPVVYFKSEIERILHNVSLLHKMWSFLNGDIKLKFIYQDVYQFIHRLSVVSEFIYQCTEQHPTYFAENDYKFECSLLEQLEYVLDSDPDNRMLTFMTVLMEADVSAWNNYLEHEHDKI